MANKTSSIHVPGLLTRSSRQQDLPIERVASQIDELDPRNRSGDATGTSGRPSPSRASVFSRGALGHTGTLHQDQRPGLKMGGDPRGDRVGSHVPACRNGVPPRRSISSSTFRGARIGSQPGIPRGGQLLEPIDHDRARQQSRQNGRGQVERVQGKPVRRVRLPACRPDRASESSPPRDRPRRSKTASARDRRRFAEPRETQSSSRTGKLGPVEQAAADLDDRQTLTPVMAIGLCTETPASGSRYAAGCIAKTLAASVSRANAQPADDATAPHASSRLMTGPPNADQAIRQLAGEEAARARDDRRGRLADRRRTGSLGRLAQALGQAFVGRLSEFDRILGRESVAVGADHPSQAVPGRIDSRGPAVSRRAVIGLGLDITQDQVDVQRRREDLGRQSGGYSPQGKLGRQGADGRSSNARVNKLAGLEPFGVGSPPGANLAPNRAESSPPWSCRCRSRSRATQEPAAPQASRAPASSPPRRAADSGGSRPRDETRRRCPRPRSSGHDSPSTAASRTAPTPTALVG